MESFLASVAEFVSTPAVSQVFSGLCLAWMAAKGGYKLITRYTGGEATAEQVSLFNYLRELLASNQNWKKSSAESISHMASTPLKPEIKVVFNKKLPQITIGGADPCLTRSQVKKLTNKARLVYVELDKAENANKLHSVMASLR